MTNHPIHSSQTRRSEFVDRHRRSGVPVGSTMLYSLMLETRTHEDGHEYEYVRIGEPKPSASITIFFRKDMKNLSSQEIKTGDFPSLVDTQIYMAIRAWVEGSSRPVHFVVSGVTLTNRLLDRLLSVLRGYLELFSYKPTKRLTTFDVTMLFSILSNERTNLQSIELSLPIIDTSIKDRVPSREALVMMENSIVVTMGAVQSLHTLILRSVHLDGKYVCDSLFQRAWANREWKNITLCQCLLISPLKSIIIGMLTGHNINVVDVLDISFNQLSTDQDMQALKKMIDHGTAKCINAYPNDIQSEINTKEQSHTIGLELFEQKTKMAHEVEESHTRRNRKKRNGLSGITRINRPVREIRNPLAGCGSPDLCNDPPVDLSFLLIK